MLQYVFIIIMSQGGMFCLTVVLIALRERKPMTKTKVTQAKNVMLSCSGSDNVIDQLYNNLLQGVCCLKCCMLYYTLLGTILYWAVAEELLLLYYQYHDVTNYIRLCDTCE